MTKFKFILSSTWKALTAIVAIASIVLVATAVFAIGYVYGYNNAAVTAQSKINSYLASLNPEVSSQQGEAAPNPTPTPKIVYVRPTSAPSIPNWSGPELWEAVNKRRTQLGVNPLSQKSELCTIASIRLNELLELGKLDGHEGFSNMPERRPDLKWIFDKYNISEFLVSGAQSAEEAVSLWENTLGHNKLMTGGEYVWGCTYAQNSFGVAIAAY